MDPLHRGQRRRNRLNEARLRINDRREEEQNHPPRSEIIVNLKPGTILPVPKKEGQKIRHTWTLHMRVWKGYAPVINEETGKEEVKFVGVRRALYLVASPGGPDFLPSYLRIWVTKRRGDVSFGLAHSYSGTVGEWDSFDWTSFKTGLYLDETARWLDSYTQGEGMDLLLELLSTEP